MESVGVGLIVVFKSLLKFLQISHSSLKQDDFECDAV